MASHERITFLLLMFTLVTVVSCYWPFSSNPSSPNPATVRLLPTKKIEISNTTCQSLECVVLAASIAENMNTSQDPCNDFYNFACGNFARLTNYNPAKAAANVNRRMDIFLVDASDLMKERVDRKIYDMLVLDHVATSKDSDVSELYDLTRNFYRSCRLWMQHRSVDPNSEMVNLLSQLYFFSATHQKSNKWLQRMTSEKSFTMEFLLATLMKTGRSFLDVQLPDKFAHIVYDSQNFNLSKIVRANVKVDFRNYSDAGVWKGSEHIVRYFALTIGKFNFTHIKPVFDELLAKRDTTFDRLQKLILCIRMSGNPLNQTIYFVQELDLIASCTDPTNRFSWTNFLNTLLDAEVEPRAILRLENPLMVMGFTTFLKSRPIFSSKPDEMFSKDVTMLVFDWLLGFHAFYPDNVATLPLISKDETSCFYIPKGAGYRVCQDLTLKLLRPVAERMYQEAYHREDFNDAKHLLQLVKNASIHSMLRQPWITSMGKAAIVDKMQKMNDEIGSINSRELKTFYRSTLNDYRDLKSSGLLHPSLIEKDFGALMMLACRANKQHSEDLMSRRTQVSIFDIHTEPNGLEVNAYQIMTNNILFPMAFLETPFYHHTYPDYMKLGVLGFSMGHKIGHSFDPTGRSVLHGGKPGQIWDHETDRGYNERLQCVRNHYGNYHLYPGGPPNNSTATVNGDVSDLIGISAAIEALEMLKSRDYKFTRLPNLDMNYSPEQMLFIQAAQRFCFKAEPSTLDLFKGTISHSLHHIRVMGALKNSQKFSDAFKCPSGSPMNPLEKCTIW